MDVIRLKVSKKGLEVNGQFNLGEEDIAIALGNFDGVHVGHQKIINALLDVSQKHSLSSVVMFFDPHPVKFLYPHKEFLYLHSLQQKLAHLSQTNIKYAFVVEFDAELAAMTPEEFVSLVLRKYLNVSQLVIGYNFHFGAQRAGDVTTLKQLSYKNGIGCSVVDKVEVDGFEVSSTRIKKLLKCGCIGIASKLLGREYVMSGDVVCGDGVAKKYLGINTANIPIEQKGIKYPVNGVYYVNVECNKLFFHGIANFGVRPTLNDGKSSLSFLLEVHILNFYGNLYGKKLRVYFKQFMRPERLFQSVEALRLQVEEDVVSACIIQKTKYGMMKLIDLM
jgi:riboflavin kinase / FMN adenylyltransferase